MDRMVHVFFVQSNISKLIAEKVIQKYNINCNDVIFITYRGITIADHNYRIVIDAKVFLFTLHKKFWKSWKKYNLAKSQLKSFIKKIGGKYHFYTSDFSDWFIHYLKNDNNCHGVSFLEEGLSAHYSKAELKNYFDIRVRNLNFRLYQLKSLFGHKFEFVISPTKTPLYLQSCSNIYTINQSGYNYLKSHNKKIIGIPFENKIEYNNIEIVIALSILVENQLTNLNAYVDALRVLLQKLVAKGHKVIHVKFHPRQVNFPDNLNTYRSLFNEYKDKTTIIELESEVSLENVAFSSNAHFYTDISSVGLYAKMCNNKVYSFINVIEDNDPPFKKIRQKLPKAIRFTPI